MKGIIFLPIFLLFISCSRGERDRVPQPSTTYRAILMDRSELEKSIIFQESRPLKNTGKIYVKDNYLFIVENYRGVHIINNKNPSSPLAEGFISVPGCIDMAIKDDVMYVDNAIDLVAISMAALPAIKVAKRIRGIFPELLPPDSQTLPTNFKAENRIENTVIVEWIPTKNN